jgi:ubiquinone/menaquinone biosynthesis C-methylase UbiE
MHSNAKSIFLESEGDAYYFRNKSFISNYISQGTKILDNFLIENNIVNSNKKVLEVGCCTGYNLKYLCEKYINKIEGVGVEPSLKAVEAGNNEIRESKSHLNVNLVQGTSDRLDFEDDSFDIVLIGFCLFWVDRKFLFKTIAEIDRVLKTGGYIVLEDFDTNIPYIRENIHNPLAYTYKQNYSNLFLANPQYYLVKKESYSHEGIEFHKSIQERISTCILYKEDIENVYQKG